jgi:DnaJ-class molecular chaperone
MFQSVDYYALLGVARDASESEIRERFRQLAREAHPDRAPREDKAEAEGKFQELTEAVNVLCNPDRRQAYDRALLMALPGGATADSILKDYLEQGIAAYRSGEYGDAAGNFALATQRDPKDIRAHHYLGLASARAGPGPAQRHDPEGRRKDLPPGGTPREGREVAPGRSPLGSVAGGRPAGARRDPLAASGQDVKSAHTPTARF